MIKRYFTTILVISTFLTSAIGQSVINSPYTRFGIGEISRNGFNNSKAMGGIATGLRVKNQINYLNPAAISAQDTMSFIFDVGISGITKSLKTKTNSVDYNNVAFDHLAMSFPIKNWWYMGVGITPYSKIGYNVTEVNPHTLIDTLSMLSLNSGEGGINQIFFSNSFNISNNLSLGLNINYLFGSIEQYRQIGFDELYYGNALIYENNVYLKQFNFEIGAQYYNTINKKIFYTVGATYSHKISFNTDRKVVIMSTKNANTDVSLIKEYINSFGTSIDTIKSYSNKVSVEVPSIYSIGFSVGIIDKLTVGFDYSLQDWNKVNGFDVNEISLKESSINYTKEQSFRFGIDYIPDIQSYKNYLLKINYRLGFYYNESYLQINENQINNYGITFGVGFPITNSRTSLNLSCTVGKKGTVEDNLIEENYTSFGINFTLYDFWFFKRKYQ